MNQRQMVQEQNVYDKQFTTNGLRQRVYTKWFTKNGLRQNVYDTIMLMKLMLAENNGRCINAKNNLLKVVLMQRVPAEYIAILLIIP